MNLSYYYGFAAILLLLLIGFWLFGFAIGRWGFYFSKYYNDEYWKGSKHYNTGCIVGLETSITTLKENIEKLEELKRELKSE